MATKKNRLSKDARMREKKRKQRAREALMADQPAPPGVLAPPERDAVGSPQAIPAKTSADDAATDKYVLKVKSNRRKLVNKRLDESAAILTQCHNLASEMETFRSRSELRAEIDSAGLRAVEQQTSRHEKLILTQGKLIAEDHESCEKNAKHLKDKLNQQSAVIQRLEENMKELKELLKSSSE
ncbi:hypothetical protein C8034_v005655 [Colletotrichum sidae]|uniref:Uncharacterized protein n=1 Tax=Colletotrichum sidae TaxID=1347389 RepID=A0A4R8TSR5_9PEZI|nr:hypothetical protein C8034_v005655 [Colletotrichum sidae]